MEIITRINEDILLTLYEDIPTQQIKWGTKLIEQPLLSIQQSLFEKLNSSTSTLESIISFISNCIELAEIEKYYAYCEFLDLPYQGFSASNSKALEKLTEAIGRIKINGKGDSEYDPTTDISYTKQRLKEDYEKWFRAFNIHRAYRQCNDDPTVLSFSHRICGWSDPRYQLTPNFSLELKTNFGFGRSSYFYTKLTYKNVEISPLSDWIRYEYAEFMEIIRYSKKHALKHSAWMEAMTYTVEACNLSRIDEAAFVKKYIIDECKAMVDGLEYALCNSRFKVMNSWHQPHFVDKEGHVLMEYRGEKISGALDFIQKILEFQHITAVQGFIETIKACNRKLQPMLSRELLLLETKVAKATAERDVYEPVYDQSAEENRAYDQAREELKKEMIKDGKMSWNSINYELWNAEFTSRFTEYEAFCETFKHIREKWRQYNQHLSNLKNFQKNIGMYHQKISSFLNSQ